MRFTTLWCVTLSCLAEPSGSPTSASRLRDNAPYYYQLSTIDYPQASKYIQIKMFLEDTLFIIEGR